MAEFADRIVLVTGAAGALGQAVVEEFVRVGATPVQLDIVEPDNDHYSVKCDLADASACAAAVSDIVAKYQRIDVLANIAGGFTMGEDDPQGNPPETAAPEFSTNNPSRIFKRSSMTGF